MGDYMLLKRQLFLLIYCLIPSQLVLTSSGEKDKKKGREVATAATEVYTAVAAASVTMHSKRLEYDGKLTEVYSAHCFPPELKTFVDRFKNPNFKMRQPVPSSILLIGPLSMRPDLAARSLARELCANYHEPSLWNSAYRQDVFNIAEGKNTVAFIALESENDGVPAHLPQATMEDLGKCVGEIDAYNSADNRAIALVAYAQSKDSVPPAVLSKFKSVVPLVTLQKQTKVAIVRDLTQRLTNKTDNCDHIFTDDGILAGFGFDELRSLVDRAIDKAVQEGSPFLQSTHVALSFAGASDKHKRKTSTTEPSHKKVKVDEESRKQRLLALALDGIPADIRQLHERWTAGIKPAQFALAEPTAYLLHGPASSGKSAVIDWTLLHFPNAYVHKVSCFDLKSATQIREEFEKVSREAKADQEVVICFENLDAFVPAADQNSSEGRRVAPLSEAFVQAMSAFNHAKHVLLATTQDTALLNPGVMNKFHSVEVGLPDQAKREVLLKHWWTTQVKQKDKQPDFKKLARRTDGYNCAQLQKIFSMATIEAQAAKSSLVEGVHLEAALKKVNSLITPSSAKPMSAAAQQMYM
jgi:hypothetical protein